MKCVSLIPYHFREVIFPQWNLESECSSLQSKRIRTSQAIPINWPMGSEFMIMNWSTRSWWNVQMGCEFLTMKRSTWGRWHMIANSIRYLVINFVTTSFPFHPFDSRLFLFSIVDVQALNLPVPKIMLLWKYFIHNTCHIDKGQYLTEIWQGL